MSQTDTQPREVQALEFDLGAETYCVEIDYVSEIVDVTELTVVPNAPHHVEGVMDLRGRTTAIIDPKKLLGVHSDTVPKRIIIFDPARLPDRGPTGWVVDEVRQVVKVSLDDVDEAPFEDEGVRGIVKREDGLVVWLDPLAVDP
jgi:purine-binding chemotaxis protein CheW